MINKALLFIVLSFLIFGPVNAAKKVTYLKCPLMMVENKGKTYGEDWWPTGAQLNEFYVKINEGKKDKVSIHKYFTAKDFRKDQKPDDYDFLKNLVFKRNNNELKYSYSDSWKDENGKDAEVSESFIFINDNNWRVEYLQFEEYEGLNVHIKHKLAGDCSQVDKKSYKKLIKTGKI